MPARKEASAVAKATWADHVYPLINQVEATGISWGWVNDTSLQEAQLTPINDSPSGNRYQALNIANSSTIHLQTAQRINTLAAWGYESVDC